MGRQDNDTHFIRRTPQTFPIRPSEARLAHLLLAVNIEDLDTVNLKSVVLLTHDRQDSETVEEAECIRSQVHRATDHTGLGPDLVDGDIGW